MIGRLSGRYGRRGTWLILLGIVWTFFGVGVLLEPVPPRPWVLAEYLPPYAQAIGWWCAGVVAVWQGLRRHRSDELGHAALYVMPFIKLVSFALSWLLWVASATTTWFGWTDHPIGYSGGWYAAAVWTFVTLMLRLVADWPNPSPVIPHPPAGTTMERF